ncbi:MAG: ABC transporter permease [Chloroflexi bacterium]|nr:ABC transporter permease [Chloroflexota bacterium]
MAAVTIEIPGSRPRSVPALLLGNPRFVAGLVLLLICVGITVASDLAFGAHARESGAFLPKLPPEPDAPLGTTALGQSVAAQLAEAIPNSMAVGLIAALVGTLLGAAIGFASGYFGSLTDALLRILIDVFLAVPSLLFLLLIASLMKGVDLTTLALVIGLFAWAWPARQIRAQVLSLRERLFVDLARMSGLSGSEIILRELAPNMLPWLGANFVNAFISAVLAESGLSLLGLGPQPSMTLGMMIYWALSYGAILQNLWWWWAPPVIILVALFFALYLIHLGLDEVSNPRLNR